MAAYVPPGWPTGVHPPGSEEFEQTAAAWLLDVVPPDYRLHGVLRRHPVALAALARHHLAACVAGAREGYRTARGELGDRLPPGSLDAVLDAYRTEGRRLVEVARAVDLVGRALRGEAFMPQLAGTQDREGGRGGGWGSPAGKRGPERSGAKQQAGRPRETAPAKQADSPRETPPAKQADSPRETAPAKQAAGSRKAALAKRVDSPGEAAPAKRAPGSRKATSAKQR